MLAIQIGKPNLGPMLRYLGSGKRAYGDHPMPPHSRMNWEFEAILDGKIAPTLSERDRPAPSGNTLWIFPPGKSHGWRGEKGQQCEVFVAHFSAVPEPIEWLASRHEYLAVKLAPSDKVRLRRMAQVLAEHYWRPTRASDVHTQRILMELCLLVMRSYPEADQPTELGAGYSKVVATEDWLRQRLRENPKISDAAKTVGLSVSQLDRLFLKIRGESPRQLLMRLKLDRAMKLLTRRNTKLEAVAAQSGFSNASNLCRAFKSAKGFSPIRWQRETLIRYRKPTFGTEHDVSKHGRKDRRGM